MFKLLQKSLYVLTAVQQSDFKEYVPGEMAGFLQWPIWPRKFIQV